MSEPATMDMSANTMGSTGTCDATTDCKKALSVEVDVCCHVTEKADGEKEAACRTMADVATIEKTGAAVAEEAGGSMYCTGALKLAGAAVASLSLFAAY